MINQLIAVVLQKGQGIAVKQLVESHSKGEGAEILWLVRK